MDLNELAIFVAVVQAKSFTAAARQLGLPKSTVSTKVSRLEERLGVRLLQRTTRSLGLTDAGAAFYERCSRIIADVDEAERQLGQMQSQPRGLLRVTAPADITATYLGAPLAEFIQHNPEVSVDVVATDRVVDLVNENFDVAVRAGRLAPSTLIARPLAPVTARLYASPAYLDAHGRPRAPRDLARHACLIFTSPVDPAAWKLHGPGGKTETVQVHGPLQVNSPDAVRDAAIAGLGIALLPVFACDTVLLDSANSFGKRGLERVLPRWEAPASQLSIVYPSSRYLSPKVRAFVDFMVAHFKHPSWADDGSRAA
ncbi:MAG TPA: LysR family transcriptional regulator [Kofleriaceae bacterium]|jgi:DNA-binding transcriptional LysR family regulator|nr:LysR family transcriptional regulator [Kofleriaceae bacterium]